VANPQYECVRHARVTGDPDVEWVAIGVWSFPDGTTEWTLEYWDANGAAADDSVLPSEQAAKALAAETFGIGDDDWSDGPQPLSLSP
jgi:hypothetical protein